MNRVREWAPLAAAFAALMAVTFWLRPLLPIDETRYLGVAWEMWLRGDWLVPFKNGETYSHKPPLLFWLMNAGWHVFGVNEWWPRLVHPLFGLASLGLCAAIAKRLWPGLRDAANYAPYFLFGCLWWTVFQTTTMFDMMVVFFVELGVLGLLCVKDHRAYRGWTLLALALGFGILAKGPVLFLFLLPLMLLGPWAFAPTVSKAKWFLGMTLAIFGGAGIALAWAIPAGKAGGEAYQTAIFWGQSAGRMAESFAHARPIWWYLALLPGLLFPWFFWPEAWKAVRGPKSDGAVRLCWLWVAAPLLAFSLVSGKQPHYLLPMFPALALLAARGLAIRGAAEIVNVRLPGVILAGLGGFILTIVLFPSQSPWPQVTTELSPLWGGALMLGGLFLIFYPSPRRRLAVKRLFLASPLFVAVLHGASFGPLADSYDMAPIGKSIHAIQEGSHEVAHLGGYHNEYAFVGRLEQPLHEVLQLEALIAWAHLHPNAFAVVRKDHHQANTFWVPEVLKHAVVRRPYRTNEVALVPVSALLALPTL